MDPEVAAKSFLLLGIYIIVVVTIGPAVCEAVGELADELAPRGDPLLGFMVHFILALAGGMLVLGIGAKVIGRESVPGGAIGTAIFVILELVFC